jgi:hypothetical protein
LPAINPGAAKEDLPERKVPRHDGKDDADGAEGDEAAVRFGRDRLAGEKPFSVFRVELAGDRAFLGFRDAIADRSSHFAGHEMREFTAFRIGAARSAKLCPRQPRNARSTSATMRFTVAVVISSCLEMISPVAELIGLDRHGLPFLLRLRRGAVVAQAGRLVAPVPKVAGDRSLSGR